MNKKGIASLLTVVFVSIIITIVVIGFVRLAINEQRQATDSDLTTRALYAAEAGLEDAKRLLQERGQSLASFVDDESCMSQENIFALGLNNLLSSDTEFDTEYTCLIVDMSPPNFEAKIDKNDTKQIELIADQGVAFDRVSIEWHINSSPSDDGDGLNPPLRTNTSLPPESQWGNSPAMLRSYLFSYPSSSNFSRDSLVNSVDLAFLNPATTTSAFPDYSHTAVRNRGVVNVGCSQAAVSGSFVCRRDYSGFVSGRTYVLRLSSIYSPTSVRVTLFSGSTPVEFGSGQVLIDSTGRAGDVYRRVEVRVSPSGSMISEAIPNQAIITTDNICKDMDIYPTTTGFANRCF